MADGPFKGKRHEEPVDDFVDVDGTFECQIPSCGKLVDDGRYSPSQHVLTWRCPDGHISSIEVTLF